MCIYVVYMARIYALLLPEQERKPSLLCSIFSEAAMLRSRERRGAMRRYGRVFARFLRVGLWVDLSGLVYVLISLGWLL